MKDKDQLESLKKTSKSLQNCCTKFVTNSRLHAARYPLDTTYWSNRSDQAGVFD